MRMVWRIEGNMRRRRTTTSAPTGFTLIELLMVISIIGLLVGLIVPSVRRAMVLARRSYCLNNLHNCGVAMRMYLDGNQDMMPMACQLPSAHLNSLPSIADVLRPFMGGSTDSLRCPADTIKNYWQTEGSSYEYAQLLGGTVVGKDYLTQKWGETRVPVMYDYEPFHGPAGQLGSANFLFADGHVGDLQGN